MEDHSSTEFKIDTLRRRQDYLIGRMKDDSVGAKRFNKMEIDAIDAAVKSLKNESETAKSQSRFEKVSETLVSLLTSLETGDEDELVEIVDEAKDVIDKYNL